MMSPNILIPLAAPSSPHQNQGQMPISCLTVIDGKPVIQRTLQNLGFSGRHIFVIQSEHDKTYNLQYVLSLFVDRCCFSVLSHFTEGSACSALEATKHIDNSTPLIIANPDQILTWNTSDFIREVEKQNVDGALVTLSTEEALWRYGYVATRTNGTILQVSAKKRISDTATVGVYYWRRGSDFVRYARQMTQKGIQTNSSYYVSTAFNQAIADHKSIIHYPVAHMWDLSNYAGIERYRSHLAEQLLSHG